jgi:hypothetical protein
VLGKLDRPKLAWLTTVAELINSCADALSSGCRKFFS